MKILLIRHGESTGDIENRYGGTYDDHLTDKGKSDAAITAEKLISKQIEAIYCSPKIRAKEAAQIINSKLNLPFNVIEGLEERDYGILNGIDKDEAKQKYPEIVEQHKNIYNTDPEGESYEDFKKRILTTLTNIIGNNNYKTIAIITHGGPIKLIYRVLFQTGELENVGDYGILELEKDKVYKFISLTKLHN
ncbi:MAG: hypothetical protein A3J48_04555 [Candidatus Doudnabacteria bacterium RIFCSPHIGHO2_02_FULL_46_11]|uniref:Phosphoglycerate mutase n=1 Tax=Candidatus Doudnabacteria bacterium RIFCSPHIGHO2_02_FULL_46_11 TaxID=1817832 RepID=A0A1F5P716_9BACT|nr:MAG: hypothetical protein A3J48_04555 [Candidatus Doudnabacteria bacterium RIFCSPHIGHO2_02_FULL_46_11]